MTAFLFRLTPSSFEAIRFARGFEISWKNVFPRSKLKFARLVLSCDDTKLILPSVNNALTYSYCINNKLLQKKPPNLEAFSVNRIK